eukprot:COSAG01_NODE_439_length_17034_cov_5.326484_13_plen_127_part_00
MPALLLLAAAAGGGAIDRRQVVTRHNVHLAAIDSGSPLTVGNGEFAMTADVTGLQTLNTTYTSFPPLQTMSHWGWHQMPTRGVDPPSYVYESVTVGTHTADCEPPSLRSWLPAPRLAVSSPQAVAA